MMPWWGWLIFWPIVLFGVVHVILQQLLWARGYRLARARGATRWHALGDGSCYAVGRPQDAPCHFPRPEDK